MFSLRGAGRAPGTVRGRGTRIAAKLAAQEGCTALIVIAGLGVRALARAITSATYHSKVNEKPGAPEGGATPPERRSLHLMTRRIERRLPGVGLARFRAPAAGAEEELAPFYGGDADARAFASALIAIALEEPVVSAADVDGWSERKRAIARVASADVCGCLGPYRRLAGSGLSGDERLLQAMRARNDDIGKRLMAANAALRNNVVRLVDRVRLPQPSAIEMIIRQQRQFEHLLSPPYVEQMQRLSRQVGMLRPSYFEQLAKTQHRLFSLPPFRPPLFSQIDQLQKQFRHGAKPFSLLDKGAFASLTRSYTTVAADIARQMQSTVRPSYFGVLQQFRGTPPSSLTGVQRLAEQLHLQLRPRYLDQLGNLVEKMRTPFWLGGLRDRFGGLVEDYYTWLERRWAELKARDAPPPLLFLLASLPGLVGLQLLEELEADDALLLTRLEEELVAGPLVETLQRAIQTNGDLDSVAKRHLVQALDWVRQGQYVDAAPPLYQGLERAFKLVARQRGVIDGRNHFVVAAHRRKARTIEDVFGYLGLDRLYVRFLRAWIFGERGNCARHGDLAEDEHRRWVLRAVIAVVGWLEYVGGEEDAVAELVERLELDRRGEDEATG
jgi:hypothetical protein